MVTRTIQKQLAGMEDLAAGIGKVVQQRAGAPVVIGKMDVPYAVLTEADLKALDVTKFAYARLDGFNYQYDPADDTGIAPNEGPGSWLVNEGGNSAQVTSTAAKSDKQVTSLVIHPASPQLSAKVGEVVTAVTALRDAGTDTLYSVNVDEVTTPVTGEITALDFTAKTATVGGTDVVLEVTSTVSVINDDEIRTKDYRSIDIRVTGEQRPLAYFGRLTPSNHSDVLKKGIEAAADEGFKLYVPKTVPLQLSSWVTPELTKALQIEFQDYTTIASDTAVDFLKTNSSVLHDGIVTLDSFMTGIRFEDILDDIELYSRGFRGKNMESMLQMRYSANQSGSLARAIINDLQGDALSSWGLDISPAVFGDLFINWAKLTNCHARFIGIGNNASGENYSTNQRVEINGFTGIGLSEQSGITELQGLYVTGCQNVHLGGQTNVKDLVHTASAIDAEGIYIKAANTTIEDAVLNNAGGNQGMLVVKGSASGAEVRSNCTVKAKIISTYAPSIPTCPAYVQADNVDLDLELEGTFTRGIQTVEGAKVNSLTIKVKPTTLVCDSVIDITPNCETVQIEAPFAANVQALNPGIRPTLCKIRGSSSNPGGAMKLCKIRDSNCRGFTQTDTTNLNSVVEVDLGGDTSAVVGKLSVVDNDLGDLHTCVRAVSGTIDQLTITGNDCMGGALPLNNSGATINNLYVKNNPGAADLP